MTALLNRDKLERSKKLKKERIESILQAGLRAFQRFSYPEVTLDSIRKLANVPEGKPELYFGSREELFLRVLSRQSKLWSSALQERLRHSDEQLSPNQVATVLIESVEEHPEFFHLRALLPMVLEHIIDVGAVTILFTTIEGHMQQCGEELGRRCPPLSARDAMRMMVLFQTYASSLLQLTDPSRAMARLSAAEGAGGLAINPEQELNSLAAGLVARFTA